MSRYGLVKTYRKAFSAHCLYYLLTLSPNAFIPQGLCLLRLTRQKSLFLLRTPPAQLLLQFALFFSVT